jgi:hypothetical protein
MNMIRNGHRVVALIEGDCNLFGLELDKAILGRAIIDFVFYKFDPLDFIP